ncbi:MAG: arsenate reductase family protein [Verrucomicrobiaceae bacterium]|nr:arsenate reductase family protein [Verrucomicrobiaceae bacterium]
MLKVYAYKGCSTCRNAIKWLCQNHFPFIEIPIRETPPSVTELKAMLAAQSGDLKRLFNTSGQDYRALGIKNKLAAMTTDEALQLLSTNGNLIKRPFALSAANSVGLVGFKEEEWKASLL